MRTAVWRVHMVDFVVWNRRPLAVDFDFVMVADHTALSRATVHEVTAGAFAVVSVQLRVKALMPFVVAYPGIPLLRRAAHTKRHGERAAEQRDELAPSLIELHSVPPQGRMQDIALARVSQEASERWATAGGRSISRHIVHASPD